MHLLSVDTMREVLEEQDRQRKLARERYQRRLDREAQRQANARKMAKIVGSGAAIVVVAAVVVVGILALGKSPKPAAAAKPPATPSATAAATPTATPSATPATSAPAVVEPAKHCVYTAHPPASRNVGLPPATPDYKATYQATINTNRGAIVIDLLNSKATCTVNSFVYLASKGFFSNTHCHRLTTSGIYVLQCGDPTGTGTGGPGYEFNDENLTGATYPAATVAMANSGPNTNGSQFFLVYKDTQLAPSYTPFGEIVSGLNIIQQVAKAGTDNSNGSGDGHPKEKVEIESVTIKKT
jgi:peptidyl-prolyl cis-trans isomerase B (cyclophilin B)